ncbi:MAG TPA: hypothetical protein VM841_07035 [Actinomycetota bacterium]|nr:hypothetical protein [Actinomycetota bacterium]
MSRGFRRVIAAHAIGVALIACGGDEPRPVASPGEVPNERVSTSNALPREFPAGFPLPPKRTVMYSAVSPIGAVVYFTSELRGEALTTMLRTQLPDKGWKLHSCVRSEGGPEPLYTVVASRGRTVATAVVGYAPEAASRIQGRVYTFFVSVATDAAPPVSGSDEC